MFQFLFYVFLAFSLNYKTNFTIVSSYCLATINTLNCYVLWKIAVSCCSSSICLFISNKKLLKRPCGKESTKAWTTQKIGKKKRGNSYQKNKRHIQKHRSPIEIFGDNRCLSWSEESECMNARKRLHYQSYFVIIDLLISKSLKWYYSMNDIYMCKTTLKMEVQKHRCHRSE